MNARLSIALVAATALLWPASTQAQTVEEFYRSKSVTLLVGSGVGGGYDTYARIIARHMSRYIPGNPTIIAKLNAAAVQALSEPAVRQRFAELGLDMPPRDRLTPEALAAYQKAEIEKWWPVIKDANIKTE